MAKSKRKKKDESTGILDEQQKAFIKQKVVRLGSLQAVEQDYNRRDTISKYAIKFGRWVYNDTINVVK